MAAPLERSPVLSELVSDRQGVLVDLPPYRLQLESRDDMLFTYIQQNLSAEDVVAVCCWKFCNGRGFSRAAPAEQPVPRPPECGEWAYCPWLGH